MNRLELDEQWSYVHTHKERLSKKEKQIDPKKGDCWLWAALDADSKAIVSWHVGKRRKHHADSFVSDIADRIDGQVQITTDSLSSYHSSIRTAFGNRAAHVTEEKKFGKETGTSAGHEWMKYGVDKLLMVERKAISGAPDLSSATTSHVERYFLTMRQGNKRTARKTLAYSKDWENHRLTTSLHIFIYNMCRKHESLKCTPAEKLGVIAKAWKLDDVVDMTDRYLKRKEDEAFEAEFAKQFGTDPKPRLTWEPEEPKTPWYLDPESGGRNPAVKKEGVQYPDEN
ncbi:MAG: hypothetical protein P1V20_04370 [Verrucomicrobiales bacterium]|nr:hypothetical protein [Verrucomicrobiales bacterium]